ncbi:MAG: phenylalanine--tRNA ligase subunit beta [Desulfatibacillaceae bacterium]|nr:phenylalanine--tRNA ligase subunit beta [Desulfatibacillaceae bacterium]
MIVSLSWLRQFVDITLSPAELAHRLTMAGLEVEGVWERYAYLDSVKAARVLSVAPHPDAQNLAVCTLDMGSGQPCTVVCGAPNVRLGLLSALALPGTELPGGRTVAQSAIRGVESFGMLCSAAELGTGPDKSGILELEKGAPGEKIASLLNLADTVFEIGVTPNRPDCLSLLGVAREAAAVCGAKLARPQIILPKGEGAIEEITSVTIDAPEHCPRYVARVIRNITVGPSPFWLVDRLLSVGLRPINNIVDVTNFVMMETGQPLHAFDFDLLEEGRIVVRTAQDGEKFITLDGKEKTLSSSNLMICDGKKPVALAGVMGGENSEINPNTKTVLIESAYFSPMSIRKTAKNLGYHTDASHRFERGVDPTGCSAAAARAAQLMLEVAGGVLVEGEIDANPIPWAPKEVRLSASRANAILGTGLSCGQMRALLASVELEAKTPDSDTLAVTPPGFRVDISIPEDLVEEIARLFGYDNIPVTAPMLPMEIPPPRPAMSFRKKLRNIMVNLGFFEAVNYSFVAADTPARLGLSADDPRQATLAVANPLSEDQAVMRTSLLPGLLAATGRNVNLQNRSVRLFELGKVFFARANAPLPEERFMLAAILSGEQKPVSWHEKAAPIDFYDMKGAVQALFESLKIKDVAFARPAPGQADTLLPGHCAAMLCQNKLLGILGQIRPEVCANFDLKQKAFLLEMDVEALRSITPDAVAFAPPPRFPAVLRDITLILNKSVPAEEILEKVRQMKHPWVESVWVFDVYEGKPIEKGKKSLSLRITYRADDRTLTDGEVNALHDNIGKTLLNAFGAKLP